MISTLHSSLQQETGLNWLPYLPTHWTVKRAKLILKEQDVRSVTGHEILLSVSQYTGVTPRKKRENSDEQDSRSESLVGYKIVEEGDLVVNIMLAWNGSLGASQFDGVVSPAYCVYRFDKTCDSSYYHHLLRTDVYKGRIKVDSRGVVDSRLRLYTDSLYRIELPVPPIEEQKQIVRFVWHLDSKVNRLIKAKRRLIELLNEQKQAIIHQAVTRGLDPSVPLKASGSPYFESVPAHWNVVPLKRACRVIKDGLHGTPPKVEEGVPFISTQHVRHRRVALERATFISEADFRAGHPRVAPQVGDVFITLVGSIGFPAVVTKSPISCTRHVGYVRPSSMLLAEFLVNYFESPPFHAWIGDNVSRTAQPSIYLGSLALHVLPCPPVEEQMQIVEFLDRETADINRSVMTITAEIDLIREYRTRLVADVVTGQIDVRNVELPDFEDHLMESNADLSDEELEDSDEILEEVED